MHRAAHRWLWGVLILVLFGCYAPAAATSTTAPPANTFSPTGQPLPSVDPVIDSTAGPGEVEISVYFTDERAYTEGTPPFERAVTRHIPAGSYLPEAVLIEFFKGPTEEEQAQGLVLISSGFFALDMLEVRDGIAHVYLIGPCASNGATYTVAQPLMANLLQFDDIQYVKLYDEQGSTGAPQGSSSSIPFCLEP